MLNNLKHSWIKLLASAALVVTVGGVLGGCYVETGRPHRAYHRPVIIVR